jgi:haloacetate dehalogenase
MWAAGDRVGPRPERNQARPRKGGAKIQGENHMKDRRLFSDVTSARPRSLGRRNFMGGSLGALSAGLMSQTVPLHAQDASAGSSDFFPGFRKQKIETTGTMINLVVGGNGPPILLLHGYPATHILWRKLAAELAKTHTVVASDLRGYGDSGRPADGENHFGHSKRAMALDQVEVMGKLGFQQFVVAGHDRGGRVAHRMALDHRDRVTKLIVMDILPSYYTFQKVDRRFATNNWYWFFLLEPSPFPETLIGNSLDAYLKRSMGRLVPKFVPPEVYAEYFRCFNSQASIHAYCEDYRAGATIDLVHDEADLGRKIECPTLVLYGANGFRGRNYDPTSIWRDYATRVEGKGVPGGHHLVDEAPVETLAELKRFIVS